MAEQIRDFAMSQLTVAACALYHELVVEQIKKTTPEALHVEDKMEPYEDVSKKLSYIANRLRGFVVTPELKAADNVRDRASGVICSTVTSNLTSTVAAKQAAAGRLNQKINIGGYRGIRSHEMLKETKEIKNMLLMLDEEDSQADVATLGLTEEVESMRSANALFLQYIDEKADEANVVLLQRDLKTDEVINRANNLYREIAQIVNAYAIVQPSEAISQFIGKINGLALIHANTANSSVGDKPVTTDPDEPNVPTPEPVTPEITAVYQKEGGDPENPHRIGRDEQTMVEYQGFTLKGQDGTLDHVVALINDQDYPEWIKPATITNVTENSFTKFVSKRMMEVVRWWWNIRSPSRYGNGQLRIDN